jgi:ketopantoate reductase
MNICFFGVGGVGGYYGTPLTQYINKTAAGDTYFIAGGRHKDAIVENGLLLRK